MASLSGQQGGGFKPNVSGESASVKERYLGTGNEGDGSESQGSRSKHPLAATAGEQKHSTQPESTTEKTRTSDPLKNIDAADETSGVGDEKNETERTFVEATKKDGKLVQ